MTAALRSSVARRPSSSMRTTRTTLSDPGHRCSVAKMRLFTVRPEEQASARGQDFQIHRESTCSLNETKYVQLREQLIAIRNQYDEVIEVRTNCNNEEDTNERVDDFSKCKLISKCSWTRIEVNFPIFLAIAATVTLLSQNWSNFLYSRCLMSNNYFVMEVSRPLTDCRMCEGLKEFLVLQNPSRQEFAEYAYSGRPVLVRGATANWTAMEKFSFEFFKDVYSSIDGAHEAVEDECQFFPFRTDFVKLREVFAMSTHRVNLSNASEQTWYIGWSNCNPDVAAVLRQHYRRPNFLPADSESSAIDWIFMGYSGQGASMHIDYVHRPSWQAQISGTKSWHLLPPPECEAVCEALRATVHKGDIILVDTNQWYHDTFIHPGEISITIGSEYD